MLAMLLLLTLLVSLNDVTGRQTYEQQLDDAWLLYKKTYNKMYDDDEDTYRRVIWEQNVQQVQSHNLRADLGLHSFTLGINEYSDLTMEEYRKQLLGVRLPDSPFNLTARVERFFSQNLTVPDTVDWRTKGYVTPVKNQGQCGSCWAFSSTGSLEGQNFKKTGQLISLSEQNLVDCSRGFGNAGCNGGWMSNAFKYIASQGGIDTEGAYPYQGIDAQCRFKTSGIGAKCTGYLSPTPGDENALMAAVATVGPVSVAIDANHQSFFQYRGGLYNEPACTANVDHAVLVVGYGTYQGQPYWLVKNSWGTSWGDGGYVMMSRNRSNQCAIASYAIYPTM